MKAQKHFNLVKVQEIVNKAIETIKKNPQDYQNYDDTIQFWLDDIGSGSAGIYQSKEIINDFGIPLNKKDREYYKEEAYEDYSFNPEIWDEVIFPYFHNLADELNNVIYFQGTDFLIDFNFNEADCCFAMFLVSNQEG